MASGMWMYYNWEISLFHDVDKASHCKLDCTVDHKYNFYCRDKMAMAFPVEGLILQMHFSCRPRVCRMDIRRTTLHTLMLGRQSHLCTPLIFLSNFSSWFPSMYNLLSKQMQYLAMLRYSQERPMSHRLELRGRVLCREVHHQEEAGHVYQQCPTHLSPTHTPELFLLRTIIQFIVGVYGLPTRRQVFSPPSPELVPM